MDELSFLFHAESLNTQRHIFGFHEVEENHFYFKTLFLGVLICWTREMRNFVKEVGFSMYFLLSSGTKSLVYKWKN